MTTKIELTSSTEQSQGCGDNCGCSAAKTKQEVAPLASAACTCQVNGVCACGDSCTCGTGCC